MMQSAVGEKLILDRSERPKRRDKCYACGASKKDDYRIVLHRFPSNIERTMLWIENGGFDELWNKDLSKVGHRSALCSRHFEASFMTNDLSRLNRDAVPTLFGEHMRSLDRPPKVAPESRTSVEDQPESTLNFHSSTNTIVTFKFEHKDQLLVCCIPGCERSLKTWIKEGRKGKRPVLLSPFGEKMIKKWEKQLFYKADSKDLVVCEIHFPPEVFCPAYSRETGVLSRYWKLTENAVPTLYLDTVKNLVARAKCTDGGDWWKLISSESEDSVTNVGSNEYSDIGFTFVTNDTQCDSNLMEINDIPSVQYNLTPQNNPLSAETSSKHAENNFISEKSLTNCEQSFIQTEPDLVPPIKISNPVSNDINKRDEEERKKMQFFRTLCSTPLELPSPKWGVHIDLEENSLLICEMIFRDGDFCINKGIRLTPDLKNIDIRFQGETLKYPEHTELKSVDDVNKLVAIIDSTLN